MERLGHSKIDTTLKYYTHVTDEMHEQVATIMDTIMGEQASFDKLNKITEQSNISDMAILPGTEEDEGDNE